MVVVGAGLAGLAAAYELERAGFAVVVLEARRRLGGRVLTIRRPFVQGQHGELGGEFVDTSHTTLRAYAQRFGLPLENAGAGGDGAVYLNGRRRTSTELETPRVRQEVNRFRNRVARLAAPLDPADPVAHGAALDAHSVADLVDELRLDPIARLLVEHDIRNEFTSEPDRLSLLFLAQRFKLNADLPQSGVEAFRIRGGSDRLARALAGRLADVRGESPVRRIEQNDDGVSVDGIDTDYCIVAAPLPALRKVEFAPALPEPLPTAIQHLRYGWGAKTLLQYRRRFWRNAGFSGDILTDLTISSTWDATRGQPGSAGILLGYTAGANALVYGDVDAPHRIRLAADEIDDIFPRTRTLLEHGATAAWHKERHSGGTAAAYGPGQVTKYWRALRAPLGRVYLAGEHTDAYTGYMEGALRSGRRAAARIIRTAS